MCSKNITIYFLSGTVILLFAIFGLAYLDNKAFKPIRRMEPSNSDPNLTYEQTQVQNDSAKAGLMHGVQRNESPSHSAYSIYKKDQVYLDKNQLYEAFAKNRTDLEREPTTTKYRKLVIFFQKLSGAEFVIRQIETKWQDRVKGTLSENLLVDAQRIYQYVDDIEIEDYSVPTALSATRAHLLHRASNLVDEISLKLSERTVRQKFDEAWQKLDWIGLEELLVQVKQESEKKRSRELRKLVQTTEKVLNKYQNYLSAKSSHSSLQMTILLTEILKCISDHNTQKETNPNNDRFREIHSWLKREWHDLLPKLKSKFHTLCDEARSLLEKYAKTPITDDEINNWKVTTHYEPVIQRVELLRSTYSKVTEAITISEAVSQENLYCPISLKEVESEVHRVCAKAYKKAYILEKVYGDLDAARQVYKVVTTLPSFENNNHLVNARRQLQNIHMSKLHRDSE